MTPYYNTIAAVYAAQYQSLAAIDTEGLYTCLDVGCCGNDTQMFTNLFVINALLAQFQLTGELPVWEDVCCNPVCGTFAGGTPVTPGDLAQLQVGAGTAFGSIYAGTGTLAAGTVTISSQTWVTANSRIMVTYKGTVAGADAPLSVSARVNGTSFTVTGTGTNTFDWVAFNPA